MRNMSGEDHRSERRLARDWMAAVSQVWKKSHFSCSMLRHSHHWFSKDETVAGRPQPCSMCTEEFFLSLRAVCIEDQGSLPAITLSGKWESTRFFSLDWVVLEIFYPWCHELPSLCCWCCPISGSCRGGGSKRFMSLGTKFLLSAYPNFLSIFFFFKTFLSG